MPIKFLGLGGGRGFLEGGWWKCQFYFMGVGISPREKKKGVSKGAVLQESAPLLAVALLGGQEQ